MESLRALLVDDDEVSNFIFKRHLKVFHPKVKCIVRECAQEGLDYLNQLEADQRQSDFPDLVFLDLWMPEMDGIGFLELYQSKFYQSHPDTKVYLMSKGVPPEVISKARTFPFFVDYLEKPVLPSHLSKTRLD
ncbi:MAG: response regulator [Salibacteraceae bacterium]